MTAVVLVLAVWLVVSVPVSVIVGRRISRGGVL